MILRRLLDAIFPPLCLCCERRLLDGEQYVCGPCLGLWPRPRYASARDNELARRFWGEFPIESAATAFLYSPGEVLSQTLQAMKYGRNAALCRFMGRVMASEPRVAEVLATADVLLPLPLSKSREHSRGYNQCAEICRGLSEATGVPYLTTALSRSRFTGSQTLLSNIGRHENVKGAFVVDSPDALAGRHVVVVDDVITTGATMSGCIEALAEVPDVRISIVALAQTAH